MDIKKLTSKLQQMKGNAFTYGGHVHSVLDFKIEEDKFVIITNINQYSRQHESAEEFLKYWSPATTTGSLITNQSGQLPVYFEQEKSQADDLIAILKDNITKVQKDPSYIPQAVSVNDNVNSIINIQKLKLDYYKQFRKE